MNEKWITRGDIYYIDKYGSTLGSEQQSGRPGVIVSNNANNRFSSTVEIVYLTTAPKKDLATHVPIYSTGIASTALCEQVTTVSMDRIGAYKGSCTSEEMLNLDKAIQISLGIKSNNEMSHVPERDRIVHLKAERDLYRDLYMELRERVAPANSIQNEDT